MKAIYFFLFSLCLQAATAQPDSISIVLFEGETYSVDIVLMNGDQFSGPHMEATFWDDGTDISHNISMNDRVDSEYNLTDRQMNKEFTLCLEPLD